jgi:hypothetical protein
MIYEDYLMNKQRTFNTLANWCGLLTVLVACLCNQTVFAKTADPIEQLVKSKSITPKVKATPVFEGRGDGITICPVTGEKITNKAYQAKLHDRVVLFCCKGCLQRARRDPDRYLKPTLVEQQAAVKTYVAKFPQAPSGEEFCDE